MTEVVDPDLKALVAALARRLCDAVQAARPEIDEARAAGDKSAAEAVVHEVLTNAINAIFDEVEETYARRFAAGDAEADRWLPQAIQ